MSHLAGRRKSLTGIVIERGEQARRSIVLEQGRLTVPTRPNVDYFTLGRRSVDYH